eukprot:362876-Chlamydomonas_euryale.AAC.2
MARLYRAPSHVFIPCFERPAFTVRVAGAAARAQMGVNIPDLWMEWFKGAIVPSLVGLLTIPALVYALAPPGMKVRTHLFVCVCLIVRALPPL